MSDLELEANFFKNEVSDLTREFGKTFVGVRIENEKDKDFWDFVLKKTLLELTIKYYPYSKTIKPGTKGKTQITPLKDFADRKLLLCIDSDYDYLLENAYFQRPFIFQTNVYALENYWSFAEGLKNILEKKTDIEGVDFDFVTYFKNYSEVIYDWLICSLYSEKINDKLLSREDCGKVVGINVDRNIPIETRLSDLKAQLNTLAQPFEAIYKEKIDFQDFKNRLSELGLTKETAYLFIRGHEFL
jgi:hypothetical protein